ncbi:MAG: Gfo/Idh/MocA family protein [Marinifilaceae bacterium]
MIGERKIRFAVVGLGHIGKRHAEMIRHNPEADLVACCDILKPEQLGLFFHDMPFYGDYRIMIRNHPEIDVVNICVPNGLHSEIALYALSNNMHVVCEKPMALSRSDAEKMVFRSLEVSRHIFVVMQNRYSPPSVWLKSVVERELLGKIFMVQLNCYWNRDERYYKPGNWHGDMKLDGGTLFTQFSHFIDIMYWLFGDITDIQGHFNDFNHQDLTDFEDSGVISFRFINGGMGSLNYSTAVYRKNLESSITIIGEKGTVKVAGQYMNKVEYCDIENYVLPVLPAANPPLNYGPYTGSAQNHSCVIANVIDKLKHNSAIATNALEGLKIVDIIERIYQLRNLNLLKNHKVQVKDLFMNGNNRQIS